MSLAIEVKNELLTWGRDYKVTELDCGTVIVHLPKRDSLESRRVMQGFNTEVYRARRRPRSFQEVEVKYRNRKG